MRVVRVALLVKVSRSFMAEVKTTLSFTKRLEERGGAAGGRRGLRRGEEKTLEEGGRL